MDETEWSYENTDFELEVENGGHLLIGVREQQREGDVREIREIGSGLLGKRGPGCDWRSVANSQPKSATRKIPLRSAPDFFPPRVSQSPGAVNALLAGDISTAATAERSRTHNSVLSLGLGLIHSLC